jgi:hypothetical protein
MRRKAKKKSNDTTTSTVTPAVAENLLKKDNQKRKIDRVFSIAYVVTPTAAVAVK